MDALAALGLASNIIQFVQFTTTLVQTAVEIHQSSTGCSAEVLTLDSIYGQLSQYSQQLKSSRSRAGNYLKGEREHYEATKKNLRETSFQFDQKNQTSLNEDSLEFLWYLCASDCKRLLEVIGKLKVQDDSNGRWGSFRAALRVTWHKREVKDLEERLNKIQTTLTLYICDIARQAQEYRDNLFQKQLSESKRLQVDHSAKLDRIELVIGSLREEIERLHKTPTSLPSIPEMEYIEQQLAQLSITQKSIEKEQAILKSLSFETRPFRHESIPEAHRTTLGWVFERSSAVLPSATYIVKWLGVNDGVFWVSGKPGSGKSTFMKFIADDPRTRRRLSKWSGQKEVVIASHYFWSAGTAMQKSEQGLLRTLLYEIFRQCPELTIPVCADRYVVDDKTSKKVLAPWTTSDLHTVIRRLATQDTTSTRFCLFIDGLDEYDGDYEELCKLFKDLAKSTNIKICVSSRPWNVFEDAFGDKARRKLYVQDLTRKDILDYTRHRLYEHPRWSSLNTESSQGEWLIEEIEKRAFGVFLWVFLVTKLLRESLTNRDSFSDIRRRLESFPIELETFFRQIVDSVDPFYHHKMSTTLQVAIAAGEPLDAMAYDFIDQEFDDENYLFSLPVETYSAAEETELYEKIRWRLNSRSRGLLELSTNSGTVTFLHRTVRDFLKTRDMSEYLTKMSPPKLNLDLTLLKMYTGITKRTRFQAEVKRHKFNDYDECELVHVIRKAMSCAAAASDAEPKTLDTVLFSIIEELDRVISVKSTKRDVHFMMGSPIQALVREQLIVGELLGFLSWKLPKDPNYLTGIDTTLFLRALAHEVTTDFKKDIQWRNRGIEMLSCILETQNLDPNALEWHAKYSRRCSTAWTVIIDYSTSWKRGVSSKEQDRFWKLAESGILSLLIKKEANPHAVIWRSETEGWTAFGAYLNMAFEMPFDLMREALYLRILEEFIEADATLEDDITEPVALSMRKSLDGRIKILSTRELFLRRLDDLRLNQRRGYNGRLLLDTARILDVNLVSKNDRAATEFQDAVNSVFEGGLQSMHTPTPHGLHVGQYRTKRPATTNLEKSLSKAPRWTSATPDTHQQLIPNVEPPQPGNSREECSADQFPN